MTTMYEECSIANQSFSKRRRFRDCSETGISVSECLFCKCSATDSDGGASVLCRCEEAAFTLTGSRFDQCTTVCGYGACVLVIVDATQSSRNFYRNSYAHKSKCHSFRSDVHSGKQNQCSHSTVSQCPPEQRRPRLLHHDHIRLTRIF